MRHRLTIDSSLKRIAWAFGCAKKGSDEERVARALLVEKLDGDDPEGVCEDCGGPADFEDADRVNCDCGSVVCSSCCAAIDGESYCLDCAFERGYRPSGEGVPVR